MAFENKNLAVIAYANGWTMWLYQTNKDSWQQVCAPGYFNTIKTLCACGDIIIIHTPDGMGIRGIASMENNTITLGKLK